MQAVFDKVLELPRSDQAIFSAGLFGRVMSRVLLGSPLDDDFVSGIERWLVDVKKMGEK